jgi:hypothetical protein
MASETASNHAGWIKTVAPTDPSTEADTGFGDEMDYVRMRRGEFGVLPGGAEPFQWKAEQPTTQYPEYVLSQLTEISQVIDMPLFIVAGDARIANMSSAYVASQSFYNSIKVERQEYETPLDQALTEWLIEARHIPGLIPFGYPDDPNHSYRWPQPIVHADPQKVAMAMNQMIKNGLPPSVAFAQFGMDWDELVERWGRDTGRKAQEFKDAWFEQIFAERGTPPPAAEKDDEDLPGKPQPANQNY